MRPTLVPIAPAAKSRPRLSREIVLEAALAIAESDGLEAVGLRAVAGRLGVTAMSLYRYVASRDELVDAVVEQLLHAIDDGRTWPRRWDSVLRTVGVRVHELLVTHPAVYEAARRRTLTSPAALVPMERLLQAFSREGLSAQLAIDAYSAVLLHGLGHASLIHGRTSTRAAEGRTADEERERVTTALSDLPAGDFPHVVSQAGPLGGLHDEAVFLRGLDRIVEGFRVAAQST